MKNNACPSSKEKLFAILLCLALALPLAPAWAQEDEEVWSDDTWSDKNWADSAWADDAGADVTETASSEAATSEEATMTTVPNAAPKSSAPKAAAKTQGIPNITSLINRGIGYVSQIGAVFGKTTGIRIGGTSVSAIAMLAIAKFIGNRAPSWVKGLLYFSGGTMLAGSGANIMQTIMRFL